MQKRPVPVAAPSKALICGRSPARQWVRISLGHGCLLFSVVCCQVEISATSWSLVQRSRADWDTLRDLETSWMRSPWPTGEGGANQLQSGQALGVTCDLGSQISRQSTHESKVASPTYRPPLSSRKYSLYSFLSWPLGHVCPEGIEPLTFRLVAICFNQPRHRKAFRTKRVQDACLTGLL
jgi:hypothetical protein